MQVVIRNDFEVAFNTDNFIRVLGTSLITPSSFYSQRRSLEAKDPFSLVISDTLSGRFS